MKLYSAWSINTLYCMVLAGATACATACSAQAPTASTTPESYIIKLRAPQVDTPVSAAIRKRNILPAATYWDNLYNVGKVALLGSAQDGSSSYRVVIVEGVNEDQAKAIANSDPNVKAGAATAEVSPFRIDFAKSSPGRIPAPRR